MQEGSSIILEPPTGSASGMGARSWAPGCSKIIRLEKLTHWNLKHTCPHSQAITEPTKSCLVRTKQTPITQEIPRDLEALDQEPEAEDSVQMASSRFEKSFKSVRNQGGFFTW
ncbi:uncharacterized protein LOC113898430 isoform X2 [Bos indicus x Bos taurus]|uniref:uncharacterized protein LOC113898430 isoform X2 n=1 Tax=Bos indicus x Bos taurus TaxID=30522 RepID=UPI000D53926D|nr:uncharacterized protein LOC113898430 isoform X2 [Bos indicus x Bos taurus]